MSNRDTPSYYVKITPSGKRSDPVTQITSEDTRILSFEFLDEEKKGDKLLLTIDDHDLTQIDADIWVHGRILEFSWGYPGNFSPARKATIEKVNRSGKTLKVEAHGEAVLLNKKIKSRTFDNKKRSEVVRLIAEEVGFADDRVHIEDTGITLPTITQGRMTDAQFLKHLANKEGFEFFIDFDGLHWHRRDLGQRPIREFIYYTDPGRGDVINWGVEGDISGKPSRVKVKGRDPTKKKDIDEEAGNADDTNRETLGGYVITVDPRTLERRTSFVPEGENASNEETQVTAETDPEAAKRRAKGRFRRGQMNTYKLNMATIGDPLVVAKSVIKVSGIGQKLSGRYYVSSVKHKIAGSYTLALKCKRDAASQGKAAATGKENEKDPKAQAGKQSNDLEPVIKIDPRTLEKTITYQQTEGRPGKRGEQ